MNKFVKVSAWLSIIFGVIMFGSGIYGLSFTYSSVARENITTPADAAIPNTPVRGPLTLKAQAEAMRSHMLRIAGGKTYAETPQKIELLNENGEAVLDESGEPVMVPNPVRETWQTATTFMTALNLGALSYAFFGLLALFGLACLWHGIIFLILSKGSRIN